MLNSMKSRLMVAVAAMAGLVSGPALADLPAVVGTSITGIQTDALAAIDLVWPLVMAVLAGFVILKIVKRAINKV